MKKKPGAHLGWVVMPDAPVSLEIPADLIPQGFARIEGSKSRCALQPRGHLWGKYEAEVFKRAMTAGIDQLNAVGTISVGPSKDPNASAADIGLAIAYMRTVSHWAKELETPDSHRLRDIALNCAVAGIEVGERLARLGISVMDAASLWNAHQGRSRRGGKRAGSGRKTKVSPTKVRSLVRELSQEMRLRGKVQLIKWRFDTRRANGWDEVGRRLGASARTCYRQFHAV